MLEVGLWLQGCILWQLVVIEVTLPVVKLMKNMMEPLQDLNGAKSVG